MDKHLKPLDERNSIFNYVQICSMVDPCILTTVAFRLIEEKFEGTIYFWDNCWER